jgi:hypothetical protein
MWIEVAQVLYTWMRTCSGGQAAQLSTTITTITTHQSAQHSTHPRSFVHAVYRYLGHPKEQSGPDLAPTPALCCLAQAVSYSGASNEPRRAKPLFVLSPEEATPATGLPTDSASPVDLLGLPDHVCA